MGGGGGGHQEIPVYHTVERVKTKYREAQADDSAEYEAQKNKKKKYNGGKITDMGDLGQLNTTGKTTLGGE